MSTTSSQLASSSIDAYRSGEAPGFLDAIRSMLALLWIELRRSQGFWLLPLMVGLGLFLNRGQAEINGGVVLWPDLSLWTMQSYVIVGPLAAALGAWLVDRDRRRRVEGLVGTMPTSPFRRDAVLFATTAFWGLAGYSLIAVWYGVQGVREATWGGPDLQLIAIGALGVVILAGFGFIIGRLVRGKFSPIVAVAAAFFLSAAPEFIQTWINPRSGMQTTLPFRPLTPWGLIGDSGTSIYYRFSSEYLGAASIWLVAVVAITIVVISLMRNWRQNWTAWIALAVSCAVAVLGASRVMAYDDGEMFFDEDLRLPFAWSCTVRTAVEVCVHPAYESKLDESARRLNDLLTPIAGLPGVPTRWEQSSPFGDDQGGVGTFYPGSQYVNTHEIGFALFSTPYDHGEFTAAQSVILGWLWGRVDPRIQDFGMFGFPAEVVPTMVPNADGMTMSVSFDPEAEAFYLREIPAATDRFAALGPEQQQVWLETNWDALRAGELTLDKMP